MVLPTTAGVYSSSTSGLGSEVESLRSGVQGSGLRVPGSGVSGFGFQVSGFGIPSFVFVFGVWDFGMV